MFVEYEAFPSGGRWPSEARSDEGEVCAVSRKRDIAGNAALISPLRGQLSPMGEAFFRYKYPPLRRTKIQPVSVRAERRVVRAMQLEVSTPSWPMFLLMT